MHISRGVGSVPFDAHEKGVVKQTAEEQRGAANRLIANYGDPGYKMNLLLAGKQLAKQVSI